MPLMKKTISLPWLDIKKYRGRTVLVCQAHADDADWGCGGTVARLAVAGAEVIYVVATLGECGTRDPEMTKEKLAGIRRAEQERANEILGVRETLNLGHPDGELESAAGLDREIADIIRRYKPSLVFTFDPEWPAHEMHPDHRAVSLATIRASSFTGLSLTYTDSEPAEPVDCGDLLLFGPRRPDTWVNVSRHTFRKLEALAAHRSQMIHLLPAPVHKLLYSVVEHGDRPLTRLVAPLLHPSLAVESFRRHPKHGILH